MAKKSANKVAAAPVVDKSVKQGKRVPEVAIEKASAKKQKNDTAIQQSAEKKKAEMKETVAPPVKKNSAAKKGAIPARFQKAADGLSSDSESSDSDSEKEEIMEEDVTPAAKNGTLASDDVKSDSNDSSNEDESDDSSSEDEAPKDEAPAAVSSEDEDDNTDVAQETHESSDVSDDSDGSDDESEEELTKTPKKTVNNVGMVDADSKKKAPKTPSTPNQSGSATIFAGNLSFKIEESQLREFFKPAGEIVDVRLGVDSDGNFKGYAHIEFESEAAAKEALKLKDEDLLGRPINLNFATVKGAHSSGKSDSNKPAQTVFVKGLDSSLGEDGIRGMLEQHFGKCGEITKMSVPKDNESGAPKGIAYVDFNDKDALQKALGLNNSKLKGSNVTVEEARPREPRSDVRGGGRGRFSSGGRFGSGGRGRFGGGGRSGGGRGGRNSGGRSGGRRGGRGRF